MAKHVVVKRSQGWTYLARIVPFPKTGWGGFGEGQQLRRIDMLIKQRAYTQIARALMPSTVGIGGAAINWHVSTATADVPEADGPDSGPLKRPNASVAFKSRSAAGHIPNCSAERADHHYDSQRFPRATATLRLMESLFREAVHAPHIPTGWSVLLILYLPPAVKNQPHLVFQS